MTLIFIVPIGIWSLGWVYLEKNWQIIPKIVAGYLLGIGSAAFFTMPVLFEKQYAHLETLVGGYFDYRQHFVDIKQLFFSNNWGYGSSFLGPGDDLSLSTGIIQWLTGLLGLILALLYFKKSQKIASMAFLLSVLELLILFMMHQKSSVIWDKLPFLSFLQFPWRFMTVSIFLLSILSATAVYFVHKYNRKVGFIFGMAVVLIATISTLTFFQPKNWLNISDTDKFSDQSWQKQLTISIFDYLPIYAKFPPITKAPPLPEILSGQVEILNYQKGSNYQKGQFVVKENSKVRLPLFDFPGMIVTLNDNVIPHYHDDCTNQPFCLGLITFSIPTGSYKFEARLTNTLIRTTGNILTVVSLIIIGMLLYGKDFKRVKK